MSIRPKTLLPTILAVDTSTDACSVALQYGEKIFDRFIIAPQQHTQLLLPMVKELLDTTKLSFADLDAIAFACGPGSFTGVRLTASIIQGLAFAAQLPIIKMSTLQVMAEQAHAELQADRVLVAMDARMQEIYFGEYSFVAATQLMQPLCPDRLLSPTEIIFPETAVWFGIGNAWEMYAELFITNSSTAKFPQNFIVSGNYCYPQAKYILNFATAEYQSGNVLTAVEALPIYLRDEVTTKSK